MARTRPVPVAADAPTLADALETLTPLSQELGSMLTALAAVIQIRAELPKLREEHATLTASVARLRTIRGELRDVIGEGVRAVIELEKATGRRIELSASIRSWAGA
jgi:hypothetical protein